MDNIYLVTTVYLAEPIGAFSTKIIRSRIVGWFPTIEEAEEVVVNNYGDIYECGYYNHCVIEEAPAGLYQIVSKQRWFEWIGEGYIIVPKPKGLINSGNFSIG